MATPYRQLQYAQAMQVDRRRQQALRLLEMDRARLTQGGRR